MKIKCLSLLLFRCLIISVTGWCVCQNAGAEPTGQLNILNWSDFIAPDTVAKFEKETGIHVRYDLLDSDETLQAKLLSGNSNYDIVYPPAHYMVKQIDANVYLPLDLSKIPNRSNLNPNVVSRLGPLSNLRYGIPYVYGTFGMIMNKTRVQNALGKAVDLDSWSLLLNPEMASKLKPCGILIADAPIDVFPVVLAYMGRDPNSQKARDYEDAALVLKKIRPYIAQFNSSYLNDVAGGDVCLAAGWSGDARQIAKRVAESKQKFDIYYSAPRNQSGNWYTMMGIPNDAPNKENAYKWINFLLRPDIAADITNHLAFSSAVDISPALLKPDIVGDKSVFPDESVSKTYFIYGPRSLEITRLMNRLWTQFKANR